MKPSTAFRLDALHRSTTPAKVADAVRDALLRGELSPGTPLREAGLAQGLGVSRNTVREAFRLLAAEGLVSHLAFRGVVVRELRDEDVADIYRVRRLIEVRGIESVARVPAAALAALEAVAVGFDRAVQAEDWDRAFEQDLAFHVSLVELSGSPRLAQLARAALRELRLAHFVAHDRDTAGFRKSRGQHREILRHLKAGDHGAARRALLLHLDQAERLLRDSLTIHARGAAR